MGAVAITLLIIAIALILLGLFVFAASVMEEDPSIFLLEILIVPLTVGCLGGVSAFKERTGVVCDVKTVQTDYTHEIIDGEIKQIPVYSYLILFMDEDGKYRTIITDDINYGLLKEGDSIVYSDKDTKEVGE